MDAPRPGTETSVEIEFPARYTADQLCCPQQFKFIHEKDRARIATVHYFSAAHGLLGYKVDRENAPAQKIGQMNFDEMPRALEGVMICTLTLTDGTCRVGVSRGDVGDNRRVFGCYPEEPARWALFQACLQLKDGARLVVSP